MPKPGPRPYECVRKAWHSDRHQPIRGSLIQEIFRIVNEVHGSATKKNKEWQEKLPIVVLRAEEIMYSKANSEAEYMDLKTLWDRLNDAIDTIIRRDDSTESESRDLLQPCIEAALHLGCSPKRSSRSQRNNSPRYYLSRVNSEPNLVPAGNLQDRNRGNPIPNSPFFSKNHKFISATVKNSSLSGSEFKKMFPFSTQKFPPSVGIQTLPMQNARALRNSCPMYPLCYGYPLEASDPKVGSRSDAKSNAQLVDENKNIAPRNNPLCNFNTSNESSRADCKDVNENEDGICCDLSLRLGSLVVPCTSVEYTLPEENKADDICKLNDLPPKFDRSLSFCLKANGDKTHFESVSRRMSSNGENLNEEPVLIKRKLVEDQPVYWPVKLSFNKFKS